MNRMMWRWVVLPVLALVAFAPASRAHITIYEALLSGPAEAPSNASPGTGFARVTMDLDLVTMRVQVSFSGLLGTTTASHIHAPTVVAGSGTANVATQTPSFSGFPLGVTSGIYDQTFDMTLASSYRAGFITSNGGTVSGALNALVAALDDGKAYLNIHTSSFAAGEIRGFLQAVAPEPGTLGLFGFAALTGIAIARRRRA